MAVVTFLFFAAVLAYAAALIAATLVGHAPAILRTLRMEVVPEWRPAPPAVRMRRVVRERTSLMPEWRAAA